MTGEEQTDGLVRTLLRRHPRAQVLLIAAVFYLILFGALAIVAIGIALKYSAG